MRRILSCMVVCALVMGGVPVTAFADTPSIAAVSSVATMAELNAAIADPSVTEISFTGDIETTAQVTVSRPVVIDGNDHSLKVVQNLGTVNGSKHALMLSAGTTQTPIVVRDVSIESSSLAYGVATYENAVVNLENVAITKSRGAGLTVNGSTVTATNLVTSGNAWGAVNVDPGKGVLTPSKFTFVSGSLGEANKVWSDGANVTETATVVVTAPSDYVEAEVNGVTLWMPPVTIAASASANGTVTPAAQLADPGADATVSIVPDAGYYCSKLLVDGVEVVPSATYVFADVTKTHTLAATFAPLSPLETFAFTPVLAATKTAGSWYTDRYAPAGFAKSQFDGDLRLKLSISSADSSATRPPAYSGAFYDTQGRNFDLEAGSTYVSSDVYIGADWGTTNRRTDMWTTGLDTTPTVLGWPIIGFVNGVDAVGDGGFRVWDNLGWHYVDYPVAYGQWYNWRIQLNDASVSYYINNELVYVSTFAADVDMADCVAFGDVKLQAKNYGENYDVYYDNVAPVVPTAAPISITATAGAGGAVSASNVGVDAGEDATITITPNVGYHITDVTVDGVSIGASSTVAFTNVSVGHAVVASFAINTYKISASAGSAGWVSPEGDVTLNHGSSATYTFTPYPGYHVADVLVDGVSVGSPASYTFSDLAASHTLEVTFAFNTYSVTSLVGANGSATFSGTETVAQGSNLTMFFTPDDGYVVDQVTVDGVAKGSVTSVVISNITGPHAVTVTFKKKTYSIVATAGLYGSISASGTVAVAHGDTATYVIKPALGYRVAAVIVDGMPVGAVTTFKFDAVSSNHTIRATFTRQPQVRISNVVAPKFVSKSSAFRVSGTLSPKHKAGTALVRVYRERYVNGAWKKYGYVLAYASDNGSVSAYARRISLPYKGKWRLRAYAPTDAGHWATWSSGYTVVNVL